MSKPISSNSDALSIQSRENVAQLKWVVFILMFFLIQAVIWTIAISITATDQSHAVVSGYDQKALNWDERKRVIQKSKALGWNVQVNVDSQTDIFKNRTVSLVLNDRLGAPINKASIDVRAFHRGRAAEVQEVQFKQVGPGVYSANLKIDRSGNWQFSGEAMLDQDRYLIDCQQFVSIQGQ